MLVDRSGKTQTLLATPRVYSQPRMSPDGQRLAVAVSSKGNDILVYDRQRDTTDSADLRWAFDNAGLESRRDAHRVPLYCRRVRHFLGAP